MNHDLVERLRKISLFAMDFDGVHTDGFVYVDEVGNETVRCSRRDSLGLSLLQKRGIKLCVISKEKNPVVAVRCKKLNIEYYQSVEDAIGKQQILEELMRREGLVAEQLLFLGDDVNDIDALTYAGVGVTVQDGHEAVKSVADLTLSRKGGEHAVRELCDLILEAKGHGGAGGF